MRTTAAAGPTVPTRPPQATPARAPHTKPRSPAPRSPEHSTRRSILGAIPLGLVAVLLLIATWADGAFDLRHWAAIAILVCVLLAVTQAAGGLARPRGAMAVALGSIWLLGCWSLLSATWAESASQAWEGAARTILYAGLVTLPLLTLPERRQARVVGVGIVAGVSLIASATVVHMLVDGLDAFLAGRLDDPVGYRNGTAALFAFAVWPLIGVAAPRGGNPGARALAVAATVLLLGLVFLTQSRGVLVGLAAGGAVSLLIGPDRLRRAWVALAAGAAVAAGSHWLLTPYRAFDGGQGTATAGDVSAATEALLVVTAIAFVVGFGLTLLDNGLRTSPRIAAAVKRLATAALCVIAVVAAGGTVIATGDPIGYVSDKVDEFQELEPEAESGSTRLNSVGGPRYDLWRVAIDEFREHPVAGVGESNYSFAYYRERETDRNVSDPHGLPFRLLAETGLIGIGLLAGFLIGIGMAISRAARGASSRDRRLIAGLAAAGVAVFAQAFFDWLWLLPGLLGLSLLSLGLAVRLGQEDVDERIPRVPLGPRLAVTGALGAAAVSITCLYLADVFVREARARPESPQAQLDSARNAERLNPVATSPLYLQASALEAMGDVEEARETLEEALDQEPNNFVTLGLLGDLEERSGNDRLAREYYRRALELNPRDIGLAKLARGRPKAGSDTVRPAQPKRPGGVVKK